MILLFGSTPTPSGYILGYPSYVPLELGHRTVPINWIPRWMDANFDSNSPLRKFYYVSAYTPKKELQEFSEDLGINFFGSSGLDRIGYTAKYSYDLNKGYVPKIKLHKDESYTELKYVPTEPDMLFERTQPTWTVKDYKVYLHNLAIVSYPLTVRNGSVDLTLIFHSDPPVEDSWYLVKNAYGDDYRFFNEHMQLQQNILSLGAGGSSFTLYYLSQYNFENVESGLHYITIDDEKINIAPRWYRNNWDAYGDYFGVKRRFHESNLSVKKKCQNISLSGRNVKDRIATLLGKSDAILWASTSALSLVSSGYSSVTLPHIFDKAYVYNEIPARTGSSLTLTYVPTGYVELMYQGRIVESTAYSVSGSTISFSSITLQNAPEGLIRAKYATVNYTVSSSGETVTTVQRQHGGNEQLFVVATKNVQLNSLQKKIKEWVWNKENGILSGLANFE